MKVLWIALANLRRMFRARANIFFVFVFPMVLILVLGATFGERLAVRVQRDDRALALPVRRVLALVGGGVVRAVVERDQGRFRQRPARQRVIIH